jgi:hypothetical protein
LPLTAGELIGVTALKPAQPNDFQEVVDFLLDLGLRPLTDLEPEAHVLANGQVLEGGVVLEDEADPPPLGRNARHVLTVDRDGARIRLIQAGDGPQKGRFT